MGLDLHHSETPAGLSIQNSSNSALIATNRIMTVRRTMGLQENKNLILEHYDAFVHRQDAEAVRRQLAEDFRDHDMPPGIPPGPRAHCNTARYFTGLFPTCGLESTIS
jgi:hypothetical protein